MKHQFPTRTFLSFLFFIVILIAITVVYSFFPFNAVARLQSMGATVVWDNNKDEPAVIGILFNGGGKKGANLKRFFDHHMFLLTPFKNTLTTFKIDHNARITDDGLTKLRDFKNISTLIIHNTINDSFDSIHHPDGSRSFVISNEGLNIICQLTSVKTLDISSNVIGDKGVSHLSNCKNLVTLNLADTRITDAGLESLLNLTNLEHLDVSHTAVTDSGVDNLRAALPGLRVSR